MLINRLKLITQAHEFAHLLKVGPSELESLSWYISKQFRMFNFVLGHFSLKLIKSSIFVLQKHWTEWWNLVWVIDVVNCLSQLFLYASKVVWHFFLTLFTSLYLFYTHMDTNHVKTLTYTHAHMHKYTYAHTLLHLICSSISISLCLCLTVHLFHISCIHTKTFTFTFMHMLKKLVKYLFSGFFWASSKKVWKVLLQGNDCGGTSFNRSCKWYNKP